LRPLGYTVPFTTLHAEKYRSEDKSKADATQTRPKHNPEKANNTKHSKTKLAWFSRRLHTKIASYFFGPPCRVCGLKRSLGLLLVWCSHLLLNQSLLPQRTMTSI